MHGAGVWRCLLEASRGRAAGITALSAGPARGLLGSLLARAAERSLPRTLDPNASVAGCARGCPRMAA
jgi:hypothetical protein